MPLRFRGQYHDPETGLHYNRFRYYATQWGRYITRDPLTFQAGVNHYLYADANPLNVTDASGLFTWKNAAALAAGAAAGAIVGVGPRFFLGPAAIPLAIMVGGIVAGAVAGGLNEALNERALTGNVSPVPPVWEPSPAPSAPCPSSPCPSAQGCLPLWLPVRWVELCPME